MSDDDLARLAETLGERLAAAGLMLATAESCTGGWIAKCITDVAGSSGWLERGFVTYSNAAKQELLGVEAVTLAEHGAVSEPVVRQMAAGAVSRSGAQVAVAVSGIAGPGGGSTEKPVGMVCFGFALPGGVSTETRHFQGDRESVRRHAVAHALRRLIELLGWAT
ncbi:MAG: nicotinamide-nucleotide amidase [Thiohalocapsa sp.]|jgi:nicotinamide-nucleotide amidase|uniref:nicotinamide-nucleotide amidase n=1 Tax=Thiohalocapsa sp. TaxID=2497641 RepID=UPI0025E8992D|nr:nicotinamide-nucleotide amidase [Thiohalocapsa sp.]MCG6940990.1 nicotinamide-nucleotide amidase [Thiohalocapsa sp.]